MNIQTPHWLIQAAGPVALVSAFGADHLPAYSIFFLGVATLVVGAAVVVEFRRRFATLITNLQDKPQG